MFHDIIGNCIESDKSRRDDPIAPGRGRGSGRGRFESSRGFSYKGLTPAIGAYLDYAPGMNSNVSYLTIWSTKIKEYVNTVCEKRVGCIFGVKKWKLAYSEFFKFSQKHEIEKRKVFSIMMGQMSDKSKNRVREIEKGITAIEQCDRRPVYRIRFRFF